MTVCHIVCIMCLVETSNVQHAYNVKELQKPLKAGTTKFGDGCDTRDGVHYTCKVRLSPKCKQQLDRCKSLWIIARSSTLGSSGWAYWSHHSLEPSVRLLAVHGLGMKI